MRYDKEQQEEIMEARIRKQVAFILFFGLVIAILLSLILVSEAHGQTGQLAFDRFLDWEDDWDWDDNWGGSRYGAQFRYNRVEGFYLGLEMKKEYWRYRPTSMPYLYGYAGYSFAAKEFQGQIGIEKGFFDRFRLAFGGEYHRAIESPDDWVIPDMENSLAAMLIKEDFQDYYMSDGASVYLTQNLTDLIKLEVAYHYDMMDSVKKNTNWSLFGRGKDFPENPAMSAGEIRSLRGKFVIDSRNSRHRTTRGWYIQIEGEHAGNSMEGDFTYDRVWFDLRRFQPMGFGEGIDLRIRVGTGHGDLPWQKRYYLGGLSTLRGFRHKSLPDGRMNPGGNRMVLGQAEYRIGTGDLPEELNLGIFNFFNVILFVDAGLVWTVDDDENLTGGFKPLTWKSLKSDCGIALANRSGNVRFEIARRTDTSHKPFTFLFRINRPF
jgi:outer membrane protein assembly factor BamA